ncbi:RHS repeat-associated core domain-containing protein [Amycolatopsis mongoliensis]|uniref:RHS repeat-associated core domain-containing protein n=1 Tax=Amycolatopsis mongoliensis TaxID=715475 RepID=A0A9Y2NIG4_9PSEU|nr:RHS repeat-associated core domain-containing protein [Amycolatopsis sp. 4-36]WIY00723.1 RHS repeat-associated core domain-containing protein [Amycolatopsis sp. 4-36]
MSNPLVAPTQDSTKAYSGVSLLESANDLKSAIESGDWASVALGAVGTALDALSMAMDPFGAILAAGVGWLIEHVGPLKEALNGLTGNADEIAAQSETWKNIATELGSVGEDLTGMVKTDTASWTGNGGDSYRQRAQDTVTLLETAQKGCEGASSGVKTAGEVVAAVRALVRDIIAELIGHLISWALQVVFTLGIGLTWVVPQVINAVAKTASKIADLVKRLVTALKALIPLLKRAGDLFSDAAKALKNIKPGKAAPPPKSIDIKGNPKGLDGPKGKGGPDAPPPKTDPPPTPKGGDGTTPSGAKGDSTTPSGDHTPPPKSDPPPAAKGPDDAPKSPDSTPPPAAKGPDGGTTPSSTPKGSPGGDGPRIKDNNPKPDEHTTQTKDRTDCGDPIDVATGAVMLEQEDVSLPGALPLVVARTHLSSYRAGRLFGPTWASTLDERIEVEPDGLHLALADGTLLRYPVPVGVEAVVPESGPYLALRRVRHGFLVGDPQSDRMRYFAGRPGDTTLPLRAVVDGAGNRIVLRHRDGVPVAIEHSGGYRVEIDTADGLVTALRTAGSPIPLAEYRYDSARRLVEVVDAVGTPQKFTYDADGRLVRWDDVNGRWYRYGYDAQGRCVRAQGTEGYLDTALAYEPGATTVTNSLGAVTRYRLDERMRVIGQTDPLGNSTSAERDRFGRVLAETDELGHVTRWDYDELGNLTAVTRPDGSRLVIEYDERHRPVVVTGPDGAVWRYEYDRRGSLARTVDPAGAATSYTYDPYTGTVDSVTDALGGVTRIQANAAGLPVLVTGPDGAVWRYGYDELGNTTSETDPLGHTTSMVRDAAGNLVQLRDADGAVERFTSTARGSFEERTDARGGVSRIEYAQFDLPVSERSPDGGTLRYGYDTELRLTSVTNERGLVWRYEYDAAGRKVGETDYNGRVLRYGYDAAGRLVSRTNGAGQTITLERDSVGRVVRRSSADEVAVFTYDAADRMLSAANAHSEVRFTYDGLGRVLSESINGRVVHSRYDALGRRVSRRTPSGAESVVGYDPAARPTALTTAGRTLRFGYDAAGRETVRELLTGAGPVAQLRQDWSPTGQLAAQTVLRGPETVQRREYGYLPDGYLARVDDLISGPRTLDVDAGGRVRAVRGARWQENYDYDVTGAVTGAGWSGAPEAAGPRAYAGTLLTAAGPTGYTYDAEGRVVARERGGRRWTYEWSAENRLLGVRTPEGAVWHYRYDPFGRRIAKQRLDTTTGTVAEQVEFAWDGQLPAEQVHSGPGRPLVATVWEYAPGARLPLTQTERVLGASGPDRFHAIVSDLVGAPAELVDETGALAGHLHTALWGPVVSAGGAASTPLRFPGQYHDPETGLHYNRYRYYDPETGRYLSHDPLGLTPAPDSMAYVDNPTAMVDPLGLAPQRTTPCAAAAARAQAHPYARGNSGPSTSNRTYPESTYGDKDVERKRLDDKYDFKIDGKKTHQSEHAGGYDILSDNGGAKGARKDNGPLEKNAYAYYEDFANHRYHPGTGKGGANHESGFTKGDVRDSPNTAKDDNLGYDDRLGSYRNAQRNAIEANDPSTAVQLNQLGYGHQQGFQNSQTVKAGYDQPHSFSDQVYHGNDKNHVHHEDHPLYDKDKADAAKAEQDRRDAIKADPNHPDRAAYDAEQKRMAIADDSYHKMVDDMHSSGEGMRYNPQSGQAVPAGGHAVPGTGHVTTKPIDKWDAAEMHGARDAARTGEWPGYGGFYKNPTAEDWAALERGDLDPPEIKAIKDEDMMDLTP